MQKSHIVEFRMRKSTKDRIKPYGYYFIQQISGLLSVNRQPKSGRDKVWQMWQEISGSCHRNISELQHVTGPLQGGKGFPVFPERKGFLSRKLGLEVGKSVIENQKKT